MAPPADRGTAADPRLDAHLRELLAPLRECGWRLPSYAIVERRDRFELTLDGETLWPADTAEALVGPLVHDLNRRVIEASPHLMVHAGGVEHNGTGMILPGVMEAGKTTLTAGLIRAGFRYLTDEAVAIDRQTRWVHAYPKPLSLDPGSWPLFADLEPKADLGTDDYKVDQWQVPPWSISRGAVGVDCPIGYVVFPHLDLGAPTALEPMGRAEALLELTRHTFGFKDRAREDLDLLGEVVREAECHRLMVGDLDQAVAVVTELVGADTTGSMP